MVDWTRPIRCKYDGEWRPARYLGPMKVRWGSDNRLVAVDHGDYETVVFTSDSGASHPARIITNVPVTRTVYLNFYDAGTDCVPICSVHDSKELADSISGGCMVKVACVELTYTEGEGLSNGS